MATIAVGDIPFPTRFEAELPRVKNAYEGAQVVVYRHRNTAVLNGADGRPDDRGTHDRNRRDAISRGVLTAVTARSGSV